ncbi:MAG TPA: hypothetical protein VJN44_10045 [Roseateles sp.]|nr:hypothetical protein [Roseateles sp.]
MTLKQVTRVRRWLVLHGRQHPVEVQAWDLVLICWVLSWMSLPSLLLTGFWPMLPLCLAAFLLPSLYARVRQRLHRAGRLRCDWLTAL